MGQFNRGHRQLRTHCYFSHTHKFTDSVIITIILQYDPKRDKAALELPQKEHLYLLVFLVLLILVWYVNVNMCV